MTETKLGLRPGQRLSGTWTHLVHFEKHLGSRLLHTAWVSVPVMKKCLLQDHTASARITISATVSYFQPCIVIGSF